MSRQHPSSQAMLVGVRFVKDGLEAILVTETGSELIASVPVHIFPRTGGENNERWTPDDVIR